MTFGNRRGSLISGNFLSTKDHDHLALLLPEKLRQHPNAAEFIGRVDEAVQNASENVMHTTAGQIKGNVEALGKAATELRKALQPFTGTSESFDTLESHFDYLAPSGAALSELLTRLSVDLLSLRDGCNYTAGKITPDGAVQPQKDAARWMAEMIVRAHLYAFDELPPKRSWFSKFVADVGKKAGIPCGSGVVGDAVKVFTR